MHFKSMAVLKFSKFRKYSKFLISLCNIILKYNIKFTRKREMITKIRLSLIKNSPCEHHGKGLENVMENMHTDVSV